MSFLKFIPILAGLAGLFVSCEKAAESNAADYPVVEAYLVAGQPVRVRLYRQKDLTDTATYGEPVTGLQLELSDGSTTIALSEGTAGVYGYSGTDFLKAGTTYRLRFSYLGNEISASAVMPSPVQGFAITAHEVSVTADATGFPGPGGGGIDSVALTSTWKNADSLYHVLVLKNIERYPDPLSFRTGPLSSTVFTGKGESHALFYRSLQYSGAHRLILFRTEKAYVDMLTTNSNTNSQKLSNPPGNITNGFGIFTAMQADTLSFSVIAK